MNFLARIMNKQQIVILQILLLLSPNLIAQNMDANNTDEVFLSVLGNGVVHSSPFNAADRDWDEDPINVTEIVVSGAERRVVGGHIAKISQIPYLVLISRDQVQQWCGGTIYNEDTIVTAAHCFFKRMQRIDNSRLNITAGESDLRASDGTEQRRNIKNVVIHPKYDQDSIFFDVALIHLSEPFEFDEYVKPVSIAEAGQVHEGILEVSGFGYTKQKKGNQLSEPVFFANQLKYAHASIVPIAECIEVYRKLKSREVVNALKHASGETLLCALGEEKEGIADDACQADSGGPGICRNQHDAPYLCGIVATGVGCGQVGYPGIYTDVSKVSEWIHENVAGRAAAAELPSEKTTRPKKGPKGNSNRNNDENSANSNELGCWMVLWSELILGFYFGHQILEV